MKIQPRTQTKTKTKTQAHRGIDAHARLLYIVVHIEFALGNNDMFVWHRCFIFKQILWSKLKLRNYVAHIYCCAYTLFASGPGPEASRYPDIVRSWYSSDHTHTHTHTHAQTSKPYRLHPSPRTPPFTTPTYTYIYQYTHIRACIRRSTKIIQLWQQTLVHIYKHNTQHKRTRVPMGISTSIS